MKVSNYNYILCRYPLIRYTEVGINSIQSQVFNLTSSLFLLLS